MDYKILMKKSFITILVLLLSIRAFAVPESLSSYSIDKKQISVSGLSSGGFMAVQLSVAYSSLLKGAGIIAAGPYYCAQGNLNTATSKCSCTSAYCLVGPDSTNVPKLIEITKKNAQEKKIDPTKNLSQQKIWLFSGTLDTVVPQSVMNDLYHYYHHYINDKNIHYKKNIPAEHAFPTDFFGHPCDKLGSPFINNCEFDAAGEILKWIYGNLSPKQKGELKGEFIEFDQSEFLPDPRSQGLANSGFLYVPKQCNKAMHSPCKLHLIFHGCLQDRAHIQEDFIKNTGFNQWADTNNIILLYPQAAAVLPFNPNACWDWFNFNHEDPDYATKQGRQMKAIKMMIDRIVGGFSESKQS